MKITRKLKVMNDLGLHARPATYIVRLLQPFQADVFFTYKRDTINARSIMGILLLAVKKNSHIMVTCEGEDAEEVMNQLSTAFANRFGDQ